MSTMQQLQDADAEARKVAIKAVARAKNRNALRQLAIMVGDDPDPEVRELARRAGVYIRQEIGDLPNPRKLEAQKAKNKKTIQNLLSTAMTQQLNEEKAEMINTLRKALALSDELREDEYFISLCEAATGSSGQEAIEALDSSERQKAIAAAQAEERKQTAIDEHMEKVKLVTWLDVRLDLGLLLVIAIVGGIVGQFLAVQSAQGYINRVENNALAIDEAIAEGRFEIRPDGSEVFFTRPATPDDEPEPFTPMNPDPVFMDMAEGIANSSIVSILLPGFSSAAISLMTLLLLGITTYAVAHYVFKGRVTLPYLMHQLAELFNTRLLVLLVILMVGIVLTFSQGRVSVLFAGGAGLLSLAMIFSASRRVSQSCHFGMIPALISTLAGSFIAVLLLGGVILIL